MSSADLELLLYSIQGTKLDKDGCLSCWAMALLSVSLVRVLWLKLQVNLLKA